MAEFLWIEIFLVPIIFVAFVIFICFFCTYTLLIMKTINTLVLILALFLGVSCKKKTSNDAPKPMDESVFKSTGTVGGNVVSFQPEKNGYITHVNVDSSGNFMTYEYSLRTSLVTDDYFEVVASEVFAGPDSNDVTELFNAVAPKDYSLNNNVNYVLYSFKYYKNGVAFKSNGNSGNITIVSNKDLGESVAYDSKSGKTYKSRYVQFSAKLSNVKLYNDANEELLISNLDFVGKFAAMGDMKHKK